MKKLLFGLALMTSLTSYASSWSDVDFGQLPLSKNFVISGNLEKGFIFKKEISLSLEMDRNFIGDDVNDTFYANKSYHKVMFTINDGDVCEGISFLGTEDEMGTDIKYSMVVDYDRGTRGENCPYQIQIDFGAMDESSTEVRAVLTVYETNDLSKKKKYEGLLGKH
jgi:hypothetical protein